MTWRIRQNQMRSKGRRSRGLVGVYIYITIALFSLFLEYSNSGIPNQLRMIALDVARPILNVLAQPIRSIQDGVVRLAGVGDIYQTVQDLEAENRSLKEWQSIAQQLMSENSRLRAILKAPGREVPILASGYVVGVGGGAFERSIMINVGSDDKIIRNLPVTTQDGIIGRIVTVGKRSSRVLLISDINSRIPVRNVRTGALAVVSGHNDTVLSLDFLPVNADIKVGDALVTSGHGGMFPADLVVGQVTKISEFVIEVETAAMMDRLDWVRVLNYRIIPPEVNASEVSEPVETVSPANNPEGGL